MCVVVVYVKMPGTSKFGPLVGAIDEGTSSARFILFKAESSEIVCFHQKNIGQITPQEGWVEQDPMVLLATVEECIQQTMDKLVDMGGRPEVTIIKVINILKTSLKLVFEI